VKSQAGIYTQQFGEGLAAPGAGQSGVNHESAGICEANLSEVQDHSAAWRRACDLFGSASQTASGLIAATLTLVSRQAVEGITVSFD
jgi:hypothetical protein